MQALEQLKDPAVVPEQRGVPLNRVLPFWMREKTHE
jgi:hypothetical protein